MAVIGSGVRGATVNTLAARVISSQKSMQKSSLSVKISPRPSGSVSKSEEVEDEGNRRALFVLPDLVAIEVLNNFAVIHQSETYLIVFVCNRPRAKEFNAVGDIRHWKGVIGLIFRSGKQNNVSGRVGPPFGLSPLTLPHPSRCSKGGISRISPTSGFVQPSVLQFPRDILTRL